tara:strand:- start:356 stop:808 length:453 start_codon:yes stop_codon:yes gene_type:complete
MQMISNCPLCSEHSLHILGEEEAQMMQCLNCGYTSTSKFVGDKETNEEYAKLTEDMKNWSKEFNGRIWIPTMMTLPVGMLYPQDDKDGNMKWYFSEMVDIPEEEQKNYPVPGDTEQYYERRYDIDNAKEYDEFFEGMVELNSRLKEEANG